MLRASSEHTGDTFDLAAVTGAPTANDTGIPCGDLLIALAEAALDDDANALRRAREAIFGALGEAALIDAAGIIGQFSALDRVANATGIPLEDEKAEKTADFRAVIGIDAYAETKAGFDAENTD
jgi:hypothetical protein